MELYLVRHGETEWNAAKIIQGQEDVPLNEAGKAQAAACALALRDADFSAIYSSPLSRAKETAEAIARYHHCKVTLMPQLKERDYGRLSGMTLAQREQWKASGLPDGVEPWEELAQRAMAALEQFAGENPRAGRIAVVSHGGWINSVLAVASGHTIGSGKTWLQNACINILQRQREGWQVVRYNLSAKEYSAWAAHQ